MILQFKGMIFSARGNTFDEVKIMRKRMLLSLILLAVLTVGIQNIAPAVQTVASNDGILRLHVIANSDSDEDQSAKLAVRDAILPLFGRASSYADARDYLLHHGKELQETAEAVLASRGLDYGVQLSLGTESFPDRVYDTVAFPAGDYDALCVRLGQAEGHNWWCVLFPPLCIVSENGEPVDLDDIELESSVWTFLKTLFGEDR